MWVSKLLLSFKYAFAGLFYLLRTQRNGRIHLVIAFFVLLFGFFVGLTYFEWAVLVLVIAGVFAAELFNTAIELIIDLITLERHPLARIAKDTAAGAVLVLSIAAVVIGLLILGPHLGKLIH